ncbi:MAG: hypothetical protein A3E23_05925 [Burkholderiales bacterium RIFCSPHIGHO2_12_FULL_65_48]|nr:MAG: hypothetical protein A3C40_09260 [Burkholderiales bacterium RIFCSPHIGHO2_02_FULL_64_19]OGB11692.1 MAG: hypothetical protein A3E23_05925 [Burkholderiales bacterium RIFCSPHIGHO2_12_FULL_65_48]OGB56074.1 MAG: hypothetical protein A3F71_02730 [Burkholderiales bacterium RIFCSPLOWO2_12_FULL_64_33]
MCIARFVDKEVINIAIQRRKLIIHHNHCSDRCDISLLNKISILFNQIQLAFNFFQRDCSHRNLTHI